jgi:2-phospho-L-lactate/phosphoenolpyruvate guanylyltransferase
VTLLVPLKPLALAKSRLRGAVPPDQHEDLVLRLAIQTVRAARAAAGVDRLIVITDDLLAAQRLGPFAEIAPDPGGGLNHALRTVAAGRSGVVAAMPADLPALRPDQLTEALAAADGCDTARAFVPDAAGIGTVLLTARTGPRLDPLFGPDSAHAHLESGASRLDGDWPTLRRDVDTPADLAAVAELGWQWCPGGPVGAAR